METSHSVQGRGRQGTLPAQLHDRQHYKEDGTMGRKLFLAVLVAGLLALGGSAQADTTRNMDPVLLYLFDSPNDNDTSVTLTGSFYAYPSGPSLQYSEDNSTWTTWPGSNQITINTQGGIGKIYFRVSNPLDTSAEVTFPGVGDPYPYFQTANLLWELNLPPKDVKITFSTATANNLDRLSFVPLPGSVLLLGSGLLGLALVYRRRRGKKAA